MYFTVDDFKQRVLDKGVATDIEILEFIDTNHPCKVMCKKCGVEFIVKYPCSLYHKLCCKTCLSKNMSEKRKQRFVSKMNKNGNAQDIILVGEYVNVTTPARFKCLRCGNEFDCVPANMYSNRNCVTCDLNKRHMRYGKSKPIAETDKQMFNLLNNKNDGYNYTSQSSIKLEWKCPDCGRINIKPPSDVYKGGFSCVYCSDNISFPNKLMRCILDCLDIEYIPEATFDWGINYRTNKKYRYDFYIEDKSCIIEMMGLQHKKDVKYWKSNASLTKIIDKEKEGFALKNGIVHYIVIDCDFSDIDFIWSNILSSKFNSLFDFSSVDKNTIQKKFIKSLVVQCWDEWNSLEKKSTTILCNKFKIDRKTIIKYLRLGNELNRCSYTPRYSHKKGL